MGGTAEETEEGSLNPVSFLIDEDLSPHLATGMAAFGETVDHVINHDDLGSGTDDVPLLEYCGDHGIVLITADKRQRFNPKERRAIRDHGVGVFLIRATDKTSVCEIIQLLVKHWKEMKKHARKRRRPFLLKITMSASKFTVVDLQSGKHLKKKV